MPHTVTRRSVLQKVRGQAGLRHSPPTVCRHHGFRYYFTPLPGCFSPFPHGTSSLSVAGEYLALGGGPPSFPQDSSCPAVLRWLPSPCRTFRLRGSHPLRPDFPVSSTRSYRWDGTLQRSTATPATPHAQRLQALARMRFQVLFHSPRRGSFHLSLTVLVHYRSQASI